MSKDLRRLLELSGVKDKNQIVSGLYESYGTDGIAASGFEGPFKMKNGRIVQYSVNEGRFYDHKLNIALTESEEKELYSEDPYQPTVILRAIKGDETLVLRITEGMMGLAPAVTLLRNNGYDDMEYSDDGENSVDVGDIGDDCDADPDGEMAVGQLKNALYNVKDMLDAIENQTDLPAWFNSKVTKAVDYLDIAHDYLMGKLDTDADGEPEIGAEVPVDDEPELERMYERELSDDEKEKLERLKDKHDKDGKMKASMKKQYGDKWEDVYYGKLTKMAKESIEETDKESIEEASQGRSRDTKATSSLSRDEEKKNKKAMRSKERQQGRKAAKLDEYAKGDKVMYGDKEVYVLVPDAKGDQVGVSASMDGEVDLVDSNKLSAVVKEQAEAVSATVYDNDAMPADAVDDMDQKAERTGQAARTETKNVVPKEVIAAIDKRLAELKKSVARYDGKGYNEKSVKSNAIESLEQIKKNLSRGDHEGFMEAQIFFTTLMSPIWDMIPAQVVNYLAKGDDSDNPDAA